MGSFGGLGSRVQLVKTTFRPARASNVGQYMEESPSHEQHQTTSNVATPLVVIVGGTVVLQNELMEDVGEGIVGPHRTGDLSSGLQLHPNDMAVEVTSIFIYIDNSGLGTVEGYVGRVYRMYNLMASSTTQRKVWSANRRCNQCSFGV